MSHLGISMFHLQAAILAELGMGRPGARQWLSDSWLLAERTGPRLGEGRGLLSDGAGSGGAERGGAATQFPGVVAAGSATREPTAVDATNAGPSGPMLDEVYRELETLERLERAKALRAALRFEIRRVAPRRGSGEGHGPAMGPLVDPGEDLRAAALDLVMPCTPGGGDVEYHGVPRDDSRIDPNDPGRDQLRELLLREATRPISERLFGPRADGGRQVDTTHWDTANRSPHDLPRRRVDPGDVLDAICGAAPPIPVGFRTPPVEEALWGLMGLALALDPGVESSIAALECRLVIGGRDQADVADLGTHGLSDSVGPGLIPLASLERIELAQLVVKGRFGEALDQAGSGGLGKDRSSSLGALRAALRRRLDGPKPTGRPLDIQRPARGEVQRIARFLACMEEAWPGYVTPLSRRRSAMAGPGPDGFDSPTGYGVGGAPRGGQGS